MATFQKIFKLVIRFAIVAFFIPLAGGILTATTLLLYNICNPYDVFNFEALAVRAIIFIVGAYGLVGVPAIVVSEVDPYFRTTS